MVGYIRPHGLIASDVQAKQAGLRPRLGAAAAQEAASPFPANVRSLFSYKRYSEQEPLNITAAETAAAVVLVLGPEAAAGLLGPSYSSMLVPDPAALSAGLVPGTQAVQVGLAPLLLYRALAHTLLYTASIVWTHLGGSNRMCILICL